MMRVLLSRVLGLFRRRAAETQLDDEVRAHLDLLMADYERRGMSPADARRAARRAFGGVEQMKEAYRDRRGLPWVDEVARDVRYATRSLRRSPGFALACTAILTLGIGLNLALFQLVNVTSLQPLPVKDPQSLARFFHLNRGGTNSTLPYAAVSLIRQNQTVLAEVLAQSFGDMAWSGDPADSIRAAYVSANWFRELGYGAFRGRLFDAGDERPGAVPVVVLSHAFWRARLGGDPGVVGSTVQLNDRLTTVIGIAPPSFPGLRLRDVQVWVPIEQIELFTPGSAFATTWRSNTELYGRLRPGVSLAAAREGLQPAVRALALESPDAFRATDWLDGYSATARFETPRDRQQRLLLSFTIAALTVLVLLIACANVNNMVLARAAERLREVGIRTALGATRWQIIRQLMTESLGLAALGSIGGLVAGGIAARTIASVTELPPFLDFSPDWRTLSAAFAATLLSMAGIGLYPAWKVSRHGLTLSMKDGGQQASSGLDRTRFRQLLIGVQLGGTCLLLLVAGAMFQNLQRVLWSDPGFDFGGIAVLDAAVARYGITGPAAQAYWTDVKRSAAALPETAGVALASRAPLGPDSMLSVYPDTGSLQVTITRVEPQFFSVMKVPILAGRTFVEGDDPHGTVIVGRRLALAMYGSLAVIGRSFPRIPARFAERFAGRRLRTIVGVAEDARLVRITAGDGAEQYWPIDPAEAGSLVLVVRARTDPARLLAPLRDAARRADSRVLAPARLMSGDFERRVSPILIGSSVTSSVALLALLLACLGVFAIVSYGATLRTKEIGIRVTLGAPHGAVIRLLVGQLLWPTALGMLAGVAAAVPVIRELRGAPFFLQSFDVFVHLGVMAVLGATVGIAAVVPAVRALRLDPVGALRQE